MTLGALMHQGASLVRGSKKGYINRKLFAEYGKMLIYHLYATGQINKANLILMDSHYSHVLQLLLYGYDV